MAKRSRQEKKHGVKANKHDASLSKQASEITANVSKPSFDKAQRKEIQKAIEAGIAQYKRQFNAKQRSYDKQAKKTIKALDSSLHSSRLQAQEAELTAKQDGLSAQTPAHAKLAWVLLVFSWLGFGAFYALYCV